LIFIESEYGEIILPQEYHVVKINSVNKQQQRVWKITTDSIMNLDANKIKTEFSFGGIEEINIDKDDERLIWLKFKSENTKRKILCKDAPMMVRAIKQAMDLWNQTTSSEESNEKKELDFSERL
jgi:hypothetical protein